MSKKTKKPKRKFHKHRKQKKDYIKRKNGYIRIHKENFPQKIAGFLAKDVKNGEIAPVQFAGFITSDYPEFQKFVNQISAIYLNPFKIQINDIYKMLILIFFK